MNSSKKILNQQKQDKDKNSSSSAIPEKKTGKVSFLAGRDIKPIILTVLCVAVVLVLCIGVGIQQFKPKVVVTIGDTKLTMDDMMYPIYETESRYLPYNEMYQAYYGTSIWEAAYQGSGTASGVTNSVGLKQEIIDSEVEYEILYQKAVDAKYTLTDEDKKQAEEWTDDALKGLSWLQKLQLNISEKKLISRYEKRILAGHFRDDQRETLNKDVDEDAAIKDISKKDYRQYDVEYYYAPLNKTGDDGSSTPLSDDEKKALKKKFKQIAKEAQKGGDFSKLISEDEEDIKFDDDTNFTEQGGFPYLSSDNLTKVKKMKNDTISDAIFDESAGYYVVIKMINNNSDESYKTACENAVTTAQNEAYQTWYAGEQEKYDIDINADIWTDVVIGSVTTDIVTAEDLQEMAEEASSGANGSNE